MSSIKDIGGYYKKRKLKDIIYEYFSSTTTHGLGRIYSANNIYSRCFWILAFLGILVYLVFNVLDVVKKLNGNDVVTVTQATTKTLMDFPAITLCNANSFRKSEVSKLLTRNMIDATNASNSAKRTVLGSKLSTMTTPELFQMGNLPSEFFVSNQSCSFSEIPCVYPTDFQVSTSSLKGNCFTFNFNGTLKQERPGQMFGLSMNLNINQDEYDLTTQSTKVVGVFVTVHHPTIPSTMMSASVLAGPGQLTRILVRHERVTRLPHPFPDNCTDTNTYIMGSIKYSPNTCYLKCFADEQYKFCGAIDPTVISYFKGTFGSIPKEVNYTAASKASDYNCIYTFEKLFRLDKFKCTCPAACQEDIYRLTVSSARWPSKPYGIQLLQKLQLQSTGYTNWTLDTIFENIMSLEVYFTDFSVYETKQNPAYDSNNFLSDLGGQLGLWIGASVFSVLELIAFFIQLFLHGIYRPKDNKVQKSGWT